MEPKKAAEQIVEATTGVLSMMLGIEASVRETVLETRAQGPSEGVVALVGVAGAWAGTGTVSCSPKEACWLAGQMLGAEFDEMNDEVLDAIGEIANMVIGNIKTNLEDELGPMALSIPTVVSGEHLSTRSLSKQTWTVVKFDCGNGTMTVHVMLAPSQQAPALTHRRPQETAAA